MKSTKNNAIGRKMVDEPKPVTVPTISAINARFTKTEELDHNEKNFNSNEC